MMKASENVYEAYYDDLTETWGVGYNKTTCIEIVGLNSTRKTANKVAQALKLYDKVKKGELAVVPVEPTNDTCSKMAEVAKTRFRSETYAAYKAAIKAAPTLEELIGE